jgi:anti-sigma B factor antagonist
VAAVSRAFAGGGGLATSIRHDAFTTTLAVFGEIDLATADVLRAALSAAVSVALTGPGVHRLVIDLTGVPFLDCTGLSALVGATRRAEALEVALTGLQPSPLRLLRLAGLDTWFGTEPPEPTTA